MKKYVFRQPEENTYVGCMRTSDSIFLKAYSHNARNPVKSNEYGPNVTKSDEK